MLKYCNGCKRDLEIDNFYSYKKSICKECLNKKVKCDLCNKEFNSTILSKHIKQRHCTYKSSGTNDSTYNSSRTNDSTYDSTGTSNKVIKNNSTSEITLSDQLYVSTYADSLKTKNNSYDKKDIDKVNKILPRNRILNDKIAKGSINQKEKSQFGNILKKLKELNYFNAKICNILLKPIH